MTESSSPGSGQNPAPPKAPPLDIARLRAQQNFPLAAAAGAVAALAGAGLWAAVTVSTTSKLGLMSVVIGCLVGYAVKSAGKGIDLKFGILGAALALAGSLAGDVLSSAAFHAQRDEEPVLDYLRHQDMAALLGAYVHGFQPMDLLFYAIAVYQAYVMSFKYRLRKTP